MEYIIETNNLEKRYRQYIALDKFNIHIKKGSIYGLIGKNGAGKTTFIRIICGLQKPSSGSYSIYGISNNDSNFNQNKLKIGAIIEKPALYQNLSAYDNLKEQFLLVGNPNYQEIDNLLSLVDLSNTGKKKVKYFSLGMTQRLGIALSLVNNPDILILDEPINGLDPEGIIEIRELILKLNKTKNITILISSHYLDELSKIATDYGFVKQGKIIMEIDSTSLERKLKKKIVMKVEDNNKFTKYFKENNIDYKLINKNQIEVYNNIKIPKLIQDLSLHDLLVNDIYEYKETLEDYYINLLGGTKDE